MSYTKHNFQTNDVLYASQLNEMDEQIYANDNDSVKKDNIAYNFTTNVPGYVADARTVAEIATLSSGSFSGKNGLSGTWAKAGKMAMVTIGGGTTTNETSANGTVATLTEIPQPAKQIEFIDMATKTTRFVLGTDKKLIALTTFASGKAIRGTATYICV